jgi:hypothetical protein
MPAGTNTYVLWPLGSASVSTFRTQGHSGAYNIWDSEGNYQFSGTISGGTYNYIAVTNSVTLYARVGLQAYMTAGNFLEVGFTYSSPYNSGPSTVSISYDSLANTPGGGVSQLTFYGGIAYTQASGTGVTGFRSTVTST